MDKEKLQYVFDEVKKIEQFAMDNDYEDYGWLESKLQHKIAQLEEYCNEHGIPLLVNVDELMDKHWIGEPESSSYYEEEYSDYEDEETSSWD